MVSRRLSLAGALSAGIISTLGCESKEHRDYRARAPNQIALSTEEYLGVVKFADKPTFDEWKRGEIFPHNPYFVAVLDTRIISQETFGIGAHEEERIGALQRPELPWKIWYAGRLLDPAKRTPEETRLLEMHKAYVADEKALEAMRGWNLAPLLDKK